MLLCCDAIIAVVTMETQAELKKQQANEGMEQMTKKYSEMSDAFEKKVDEAEKEEAAKGHHGGEHRRAREWELEVERDQNVRIISETQTRITREIQYVFLTLWLCCFVHCPLLHPSTYSLPPLLTLLHYPISSFSHYLPTTFPPLSHHLPTNIPVHFQLS